MDPARIALLVVGAVAAATLAGVSAAAQNKQIQYQQDIAKENTRVAQMKAAVDMKERQKKASRQQAATAARMASTGIDASSGSFLDLVGQGAAAGELDILKAKYEGDSKAWSLNNTVNELQMQKKNAWVEAGLAAGESVASSAGKMGLSSASGDKTISASTTVKKSKNIVDTDAWGSFA